ncbi:MAG: hypothetical protein HYS78_00680 [Parcubacteria group bacterium]|nr:hypothetical protein [Parcubacteria group bacterium]
MKALKGGDDMGSVRDFRKLLSDFEHQVKELSGDIAGVFRVGKPIPPKERLAKANLLLKLADSVLGRLKPLLDNLEQVVARGKRDRENFIRANQLADEEESAEEEEPANAV